jgi:acetate kinase
MTAMRVLTVNPGSSSVKLAVVDDGVELASTTVDTASADAAREPLTDLASRLGPVAAVGVRFVHGGDRTDPTVLDEQETARLTSLTPLAPLHQPLALELAGSAVTLAVPVVACFDTAFHAHMPEPAMRYALPKAWVEEYGLRRYGFHGLSCARASRRTAELLDADVDELRLVCCHIGSGVSVTAIRDGHSVDTSMGFTPLEGAVMSTRSGTVDPGLLLFLLRAGVADAAGLELALDRRSGLAGLTGTSGDIRDVLAARQAGDADAELAVRVYLHRLRREIGAVSACLDRLDAVVLTGGVAEHQPGLVAELVGGLGLFGVSVDADRLRDNGDRIVSPAEAAVRVLVVTAREDLEIARQATTAVQREGVM